LVAGVARKQRQCNQNTGGTDEIFSKLYRVPCENFRRIGLAFAPFQSRFGFDPAPAGFTFSATAFLCRASQPPERPRAITTADEITVRSGRQIQENAMFKTSILALAVASVGAALVASSPAEARPGFRTGFKGGFHRHHFRPHFHSHRYVRWHRPWIYGVGAATLAGPAYAAPAPAAGCPAQVPPDPRAPPKDRCKVMPAAPQLQQQTQPQAEPGETEPAETETK
jgi:hypothetical protein